MNTQQRRVHEHRTQDDATRTHSGRTMLSSASSSPVPCHLSHGACTHRQMMACNTRLYVACNLLVSENTINIYELQSRVKSSKSRVISYQTNGSITLCSLSSHRGITVGYGYGFTGHGYGV